MLSQALPLAETLATALTSVFLVVIMSHYAVLLSRKGKKEENGFSPPLSVIIPAHNEGKYIAGTIESVLRNGYRGRIEITVINDGSTDNTEDVLKTFGRKIRVIKTSHVGKSAAMNRALRTAKHDIVVTVDGDTRLGDGALSRLVAPHRNPDVAATSGSVRVGNPRGILGMFQRIEYFQISLFRSLCGRVGGMIYTAGTLSAFKKSVLMESGGFSRNVLLEDIDLACRLLAKGKRVVFVDNADSITNVPETLKWLVRQRKRWFKGGIQILKKHRGLGRKNRGAGLFTLPIMSYWYAHASLMGFAIIAQILLGYYTFFYSSGVVFSNDVLLFFLSWFSLFGIINLAFQMLAGNFPVTSLSLLNVAAVSMVYGLIAYSMFWFRERVTLRDIVVMFFMMPYWLFIMLIQAGSNVYWLFSEQRNWWGKQGNRQPQPEMKA